MKINLLKQITGGLSTPSKMPGYAYNLPATKCKTGSKLRKIPGSVCSKCYAHKGRYVFSNVKNAQERRLSKIDTPGWVDAMVVLIKHYGAKSGVFRWHDSSDLQSVEHLRKIVNIARRTSTIKHWLPTKETKLVKLAINRGLRIPKNLIIRHSVHMIGAIPTNELKRLNTSTVDANYGFKCPVKSGTETCDDYKCRACWQKEVKNVDYRSH